MLFFHLVKISKGFTAKKTHDLKWPFLQLH